MFLLIQKIKKNKAYMDISEYTIDNPYRPKLDEDLSNRSLA